MQGLGQGGRQARFALLVGEARVGGAELQVGDQAVELPVAAGDDDEGAFLYFLGGTVSRARKDSFSPPPTM